MKNFSKQIELGLYTLVLLLSLMLLSYIGSADVSKGYTKLKLSEVVSVSKIVQQKINTFLYSGQRAKDFTGFKTFTNPVVYSNLSVLKVAFENNKKEILFSNQNNSLGLKKEKFSLITDKGIIPETSSENKIIFKESGSYYKIELPLYSKFESVGYMSVLFSKKAIKQTLDSEFSKIYYSIPVICLLYLVFLVITHSKWKERWKIFITSSYSVAYITLASFMIYTLIILYTGGIEGKSKALIQTLADRITLASELKVPIESFSKLDVLLDSYIGKDSDVALIELRKENEIIVSSSNSFDDSSLEIRIDMTGNYEKYYLSAYIPKTIIYEKLWRNTKTF